MKKLLAFSFISTKLGFLLCFGLMGSSFGTDLVFAETSPCHLEASAKSDSTDDGCNTCELAVDAWSQDFIMTDIAFDIEDLDLDGIVTIEDFFGQEKTALQNTSSPDPPDSIAVLNPHLVFQQSIVLVI